jgi:hypothetical protein
MTKVLTIGAALLAFAAPAFAAHATFTNKEVLGKWCLGRADGAVGYYDQFCDDGAVPYLVFGRAKLTGTDLDCRYVSVKGRGDYPRSTGFPVHGWKSPMTIVAVCAEADGLSREVHFTIDMSRGQLVVQREG